MAHAFARGLASLASLRFVLGLGEAGNWPGAAKVIAEWFPVRQRALGMGIFNSGTSIGVSRGAAADHLAAAALRMAGDVPGDGRARIPLAGALAARSIAHPATGRHAGGADGSFVIGIGGR